MKKSALILLGCLVLAVTVTAGPGGSSGPASRSAAAGLPPSPLFDALEDDADVVYLVANSSVVFGPDARGRSEEITFVGPVTVPKWPMRGYGRRVLPDGRQQIDMELTQSELTGESYLLGGPVILGEHPDLRSLGTITERPAEETEGGDGSEGSQDQGPSAADTMSLADFARQPRPAQPAATQPTARPTTAQLRVIQNNVKRLASILAKLESIQPLAAGARAANVEQLKPQVSTLLTELSRIRLVQAEVVPADFTVERKVLLTTAKGILYNETAVPVRGRIDAIPPVKFEGTPQGVNVFRGMELPVALLDKDGNVNGWFYSKAHMAYAVLPAALERAFLRGTLELRSGNTREAVAISGPVEIHHLREPGSAEQTEFEVMVLALRGRSELLGGDIMVTETFSDRDHFSRGQMARTGTAAASSLELFVDLYAPSAKLTAREPLVVSGRFAERSTSGRLEKGRLVLPLVSGRAELSSSTPRMLYDEAEAPSVEIVGLSLTLGS